MVNVKLQNLGKWVQENQDNWNEKVSIDFLMKLIRALI